MVKTHKEHAVLQPNSFLNLCKGNYWNSRGTVTCSCAIPWRARQEGAGGDDSFSLSKQLQKSAHLSEERPDPLVALKVLLPGPSLLKSLSAPCLPPGPSSLPAMQGGPGPSPLPPATF